MVIYQGRESSHIFIPHLHAFGTQLLQGCFHIEGIPQHNRIDDQPQRSELVFLAFAVPLAEFSSLAMEDGPCHTMAALPPIPWLARRRKACSRVDRVSAMLARHSMLQH